MPAGRTFAVVFHSRRLWLYDAKSNELMRAPVSGQDDISSADFAPDGRLLVADQNVQVSQYRLGPVRLDRRYSPRPSILVTAYRYGLVPLYTVFPKPGELDKTFEYFLTGKETKGDFEEDLAAAQRVVDPWTPLWSSAAFTVVVLVIACLYIEWQEF
jgi:hypothetical protein